MKENLPINKAEKPTDALLDYQRKKIERIAWKAITGYERAIYENLPAQDAGHFKIAQQALEIPFKPQIAYLDFIKWLLDEILSPIVNNDPHLKNLISALQDLIIAMRSNELIPELEELKYSIR
jgi:hypothetical protein